VLDGADRRDGRHVQGHAHELRVRLVEVARVPRDGGHAILDVFQHQVVLRLLNSQSGVDAADDQVVRQKGLLFVC